MLTDLALDLAIKSTALSASLPAGMRPALAGLVRSMNCYYSNLIEGHSTHPIDIERALRQDFSADPEKRNLQREALSYIQVQSWIDGSGLTKGPLHPESLKEIHARFCERLPEELLVQQGPDGRMIPIIPGAFRDGFVQVGEHIPPSPGAVPRLLEHLHRMLVQAPF